MKELFDGLECEESEKLDIKFDDNGFWKFDFAGDEFCQIYEMSINDFNQGDWEFINSIAKVDRNGTKFAILPEIIKDFFQDALGEGENITVDEHGDGVHIGGIRSWIYIFKGSKVFVFKFDVVSSEYMPDLEPYKQFENFNGVLHKLVFFGNKLEPNWRIYFAVEDEGVRIQWNEQ